MNEIESNEELLFNDTSGDDLIQEINEKLKRWSSWKFAALSAMIALLSSHPYIFMFFTVLTFFAFMWDETRKSVVLFYNFDEQREAEYRHFIETFESTIRAKKIWHIEAEGKVRDMKRNAGASYLIRRKETNVSPKPPRFLKSNIPLPTIGVGRQKICFLPDRVLIIGSTHAASIQYSDLEIEISSTRFIESGWVPSDAQVVDRTWQYVNKSGGPDKRFKNNRQIPICLYEEVNFRSANGLNEQIQLSKLGQFEHLKNAILVLKQKAA